MSSMEKLIDTMSDHQRHALLGREPALPFLSDTVHGRGPVLAALQRRGLIDDHRPRRLTPLGERVCKRLEATVTGP